MPRTRYLLRCIFNPIFNETNIIAATLSPESGLSRVNSLEMFGYFVFIAAAAAAASVAYAMCVYVHVCGYTLYISILWLLQASQRSGLVVTCGRALHPPLPFLFFFLNCLLSTPWFFPDVSCVYLSLSYCSGSFISRRKTRTPGQPRILSDSFFFLWRSSRSSCIFPHTKTYWKTGTLIWLSTIFSIWALYSAPNQKLSKLSIFRFYRNAITTLFSFQPIQTRRLWSATGFYIKDSFKIQP